MLSIIFSLIKLCLSKWSNLLDPKGESGGSLFLGEEFKIESPSNCYTASYVWAPFFLWFRLGELLMLIWKIACLVVTLLLELIYCTSRSKVWESLLNYSAEDYSIRIFKPLLNLFPLSTSFSTFESILLFRDGMLSSMKSGIDFLLMSVRMIIGV